MRITEFQKIAEMLAREHKIKIIEGRNWSMNTKSREVYYNKNDVYTLPEDHILGFLLHEIAHVHYTTHVELPKENKDLMHTIVNMVEDISIENIISGDYPNAGEILEETKKEVLDTLLRLLPTMENITEYERALLYAAAKFEGRGFAFEIDQYEKLGSEISKLMIKEKELIYTRKATKDLLPLCQKIMDILIKELEEPTEEDNKTMAQNADENGQGKEKEIDQGTKKGNAKKQIIADLKKGNGWSDKFFNYNTDIVYIDNIGDQARIIGKKLRTILKINNAMEFGGKYRTGKLLTKRLKRIKINKDTHPFARRIIKSNKSYAFAISSDVSGSMFPGGDPYKMAGNSAISSLYMVGEALRTAGIERSLSIFGTKNVVIEELSKKQIRWESLAGDKNRGKAGGGTNIENAITGCMKELEKSRAERKIMIILTDGDSGVDAMKKAREEATKKGIECLGITIGASEHREGPMELSFEKGKIIKIKNASDGKEIGKAFIDILQKSITTSLKE